MSTEIENPETPVEATTTPAAPEETAEAVADEGQKPQRKRRDGDEEVTDEQLMEMFDFSKTIPRVERPSKEAHQAKINELNAQITELEAKRDAITEQINNASASAKADDGLMAVKKELESLFQTRSVLDNERKALIAAQKQLRANLDKLAAEKKSASQSVKYNSLEDINKAINDLQRLQSTTSMSLSDEKKLLKEIDALTASKRMIATIDSKKSSMEEGKKSREEINAALDLKKKEMDSIYKQIDAQKKIQNEINAKHDEQRSIIPGLVQQRNEIRGETNKIKTEIRALRDQFRTDNNAWYLSTRAQKLQRKQQYEEEKARREAEYAAKAAEREAEEAKKIPYEEEMGLCDYLVKYLENTYVNPSSGKKGKEEKSSSSNKETKKIVDDPFANFKPMKKNDEEEENYFKKSGGKTKRNRAKKTVAEVKFELNIDTFEQFGLLSLNPPLSFSDVPAKIDELKSKKEWYSKQPRGSVPTAKDIRKATEAENAKYKQKSNGNKNNKKNSAAASSDEDFVPLGSAVAAAPAVPVSWGKK